MHTKQAFADYLNIPIQKVIATLIEAIENQSTTTDDLVNSTIGRMLAQIGIKNDVYQPWDSEGDRVSP